MEIKLYIISSARIWFNVATTSSHKPTYIYIYSKYYTVEWFSSSCTELYAINSTLIYIPCLLSDWKFNCLWKHQTTNPSFCLGLLTNPIFPHLSNNPSQSNVCVFSHSQSQWERLPSRNTAEQIIAVCTGINLSTPMLLSHINLNI